MPLKMNLINACKYKKENPEFKVYYQELYPENEHFGEKDAMFTEELHYFREEFRFELADGAYPYYMDQDSQGFENIYARHIFGEILCETIEDYEDRLNKKLLEEEARKLAENKRIDNEIEALLKKKTELEKKKERNVKSDGFYRNN